MKILHLLSQKPEAQKRYDGKSSHQRSIKGRTSELPPGRRGLPGIAAGNSSHSSGMLQLRRVWSGDIPYDIVGMSDVMPYRSCRFSNLSEDELSLYQKCFREELNKAVTDFQPDIIHSNHLWILTSTAKKVISRIPVAATCHGTDIRQYHFCPDLRNIVSKGAQS